MEALREGIVLLSSVEAPFRKHSFCYQAYSISYQCRIEGKQGGCSRHKIVQVAIIALLFLKREASKQVEEQKGFDELIDKGKSVNKVLQQLLSKKGIYKGQEWIGVDRFLTLQALQRRVTYKVSRFSYLVKRLLLIRRRLSTSTLTPKFDTNKEKIIYFYTYS